MLKWVDDVAHHEYSNNKCYASFFKYIENNLFFIKIELFLEVLSKSMILNLARTKFHIQHYQNQIKIKPPIMF